MQFPFRSLVLKSPVPKIHRVEAKNFTVVKISGETGDIIKVFMVGLTKPEATAIAKTATTFNAKRGVKDHYKVVEEKYDGPR